MRVIVADDEEIIRTGIVELIRWKELGYEVVGEAEDGEEALALIEELRPEVVVTDIKMPFISGIELLKKIHDKYDPLYTILLTGYDEFKFAQEAVNHGAYAYLLKPVEPAKLENILAKIKEECCDRQAVRDYIKESKLQNTIRKTIYGIGNSDEIMARFEEYGLDSNELYFNVSILEIDDYANLSQEEYKNWIESAKSFFYQIIQLQSGVVSQSAIAENQGFTFVVVAWADDAGKLELAISKKINEIRSAVEQKKFSLSAAVGKIYKGANNAKKSYEEAVRALSLKFILGKNKDIYYDNAEKKLHEQQSAEMDVGDIAAKIDFASKESVIVSYDNLIKNIKSKGAFSYIYVQMVITSVYIYSLQLLRKAEVNIDKVFGNPLQRFEKIIAQETADERVESLKALLLEIHGIIEANRSNMYSEYISKAQEYIDENYSKKELNLNEITKYVSVSQAHFCVEFKKKTGETFIDYLTRIRMEKAKEALTLTERKIYEIAEMTGYHNSTYFSTLFKKHFNVSPSDYKNSIKQINQ